MTVVHEPYVDVLDGLIGWAAGAGFQTTILVDRQGEVDIVLLVRYRSDFLDVVHMRGPHRAEAARVPHDESASVFRPVHVVWHYYGDAVAVLSLMRRLVDSAEQVPSQPYPPPRQGQHPRPLTITLAEQGRRLRSSEHLALMVS